MTVIDHPKAAAQREAQLPLSHDIVAEHAAVGYKGGHLYDHDRGRWLSWDGAKWSVEHCGEALERARTVCRYFATAEQRESKREKLGARAFATGVDAFLRADPRFAVRSHQFDDNPWLLGTPGGTVDLRTGEVEMATPKQMITMMTAVTPERMPTPIWDRFLAQTTGDDADLAAYLQRVAGYCLTGETTAQALFFIHGSGGNGKGVFLHTLRNILADYATDSSSRTFVVQRNGEAHTTELARLVGKRMVTVPETRSGQSWDVERIKAITGGDRIIARFMRQDDFEFTPQLKLIISGNHRPDIEDVDPAMTRRMRLIPFEHTPPTPDQYLEHSLRAEWPGILQWAIEGCLDWAAEGLREPATVLDQTAEYLQDEDVFGAFLDSECETDTIPICVTAQSLSCETTKLYDMWCSFAKATGEQQGHIRKFRSELKRRGYRLRKSVSTRRSIVIGIAPKPQSGQHRADLG